MKQYVKIAIIAIWMFLLILGVITLCAAIGGETISWAWMWEMVKIELLSVLLAMVLIGAVSIAVKWLMSE
jgi:hypothetical protein